jgi:hypothetical protein
MFYWDWLVELGLRGQFVYYILATIVIQTWLFSALEEEKMHGLDDYVAVGTFLLAIVPLIGVASIWALPLIVPMITAFGIHKAIDLFLTGKYQIVRKE